MPYKQEAYKMNENNNDIQLLDVLCINCGHEFKTRKDRFPICKCGHTIPIINDAPYAIYNFSDTPPTVTVVRGRKETKISIENENEIINNVTELQFQNEVRLKELLLNDVSLYKDYLQNYSSGEMLAHDVMFKRSDVYRAFFKKGRIKESLALLHDKKFRRFDDYIQREAFNKIIDSIDTNELNNQETCIAIDCYINNFSEFTRQTLIAGNVTVEDYEDLYNNTDFSIHQILKFIGELQSVFIKSGEAVQAIKDFDFYTSELNKWFDIKYKENVPIYSNLHIAKITYEMYQKNGLLSYRKYASKFNNKYNEYSIGEFKIRLLNADDVSKLSIGMLPTEEITAPLIGVYNSKDALLSLIVNCNGKIMISGNQKDEIKATINSFLDMIDS